MAWRKRESDESQCRDMSAAGESSLAIGIGVSGLFLTGLIAGIAACAMRTPARAAGSGWCPQRQHNGLAINLEDASRISSSREPSRCGPAGERPRLRRRATDETDDAKANMP